TIPSGRWTAAPVDPFVSCWAGAETANAAARTPAHVRSLPVRYMARPSVRLPPAEGRIGRPRPSREGATVIPRVEVISGGYGAGPAARHRFLPDGRGRYGGGTR